LTCEEGWSFIAEWSGVPLRDVLKLAGIKPEARFVAYFSIETGWWDSLDIGEALHTQTLLCYGMNGADLPPGHGGPLRLRVPRQLGYKSVKYITRIVVTDDIRKIENGLGASSPEFGYSWYAGI
jgi:DMSO/TMAO reductase YedYZ molybdopterin-dependent catalytic subunit